MHDNQKRIVAQSLGLAGLYTEYSLRPGVVDSLFHLGVKWLCRSAAATSCNDPTIRSIILEMHYRLNRGISCNNDDTHSLFALELYISEIESRCQYKIEETIRALRVRV